MQLTGNELAVATQGVWHGGEPDVVNKISTDSRNIQQGEIFLALRGEYFDGHQFAASLSQPALALIGDTQGVKTWADWDVPYLEVDDTLQALGAIAHAWREKLAQTSVVGITGSYGKTTVRSMLAHLLTGLGLKVHATDANLNNLIGVPQTLLATPLDADVALIECGISEQGEMQRLADILSPDGVVMTGITSAHAEGLGGLQGVVQEKSRLLSAVKKDGWCALGQGVSTQLEEEGIHVVCQAVNHAVTWVLQGLDVTFYVKHTSANLRLSLPAQHWCENMALVLSIALERPWKSNRSADLQDMVDILATWQPVEGRLQVCAGIHGSQILNDAYNANPVSMQAALHTLQSMPTRRIVILGDMKELGEDAEQAHQQLQLQDIECIWLVGEHMYALHQQYLTSQWFLNVDGLLAWLMLHMEKVMKGDTVLVKASHSMGLEKVVDMLKVKDIDCAV